MRDIFRQCDGAVRARMSGIPNVWQWPNVGISATRCLRNGTTERSRPTGESVRCSRVPMSLPILFPVRWQQTVLATRGQWNRELTLGIRRCGILNFAVPDPGSSQLQLNFIRDLD